VTALEKHIASTETQICISLAGRIAERRARRCDDDGRRCEFLLNESQRNAVHEAGHAAVGVALGWICSELTVVPETEVLVGSGTGHLAGFASIHEAPLSENALQRASRRKVTRYLESDAQKVAQLSLQLALVQPDYGWRAARRIIRTLRAKTEALVEKNWHHVSYLANTLEWRKTMTHAEIRSCLRGITLEKSL
jgi:hypothetical protein